MRIWRIALIVCALLSPLAASAQSTEEGSDVEGKVEGINERLTTLEGIVATLAKLKISGYVQPQWNWTDSDTLGSQNTRNAFTIRRGRIKFTHKIGDVTYTLYPDVTERGVEMKEVWVMWQPLTELGVTMGAMNRPFGYEIGYSSSSREIAERSLAENRLFNGERDLGLQFTVTPTFGGFSPLLEVGLFNGSDNFGVGPVSALGSTNKLGFSSLIGTPSAPFATTGADSLFRAQQNAALGAETQLTLLPNGSGLKVNQREFIGHIRLPFLISDEFSIDLGGSWSLGGVVEPTDVIGTYSGTNGALELKRSENTEAAHSTSYANGSTRSGLFFTNRQIFGADAQIYLNVLPFGGTILKSELYRGQMPFYGSAGLFAEADFNSLGAPVASTIYKNVFGFYSMLVQNLGDDYQLAVRYEIWDPNTDVSGKNFAATNDAGTATAMRGVSASTGFGGDLAVSTLSAAFSVYVSGAVKLMANYDMPMTEDFTRVRSKVVHSVSDAHDDRFTFRMQYKF